MTDLLYVVHALAIFQSSLLDLDSVVLLDAMSMFAFDSAEE